MPLDSSKTAKAIYDAYESIKSDYKDQADFLKKLSKALDDGFQELHHLLLK